MKITFTFLLLLFLSGMSVMGTVHAVSPLTLDGVGTDTTCRAPICEAQLLTTTQGYDIVLLNAECGYTYCPITISSIIDSSGLTFTQRVSYAPNDKLSEYCARATSPLKSDNITVVFSADATIGIQVLAIHGPNTRLIFDPNPSIPATCTIPSCGDCTASFNFGTCSASIQTSTIDFVIAATAINDAGPCGDGGPASYPHRVPGFTTITPNSGGWFEVDYAITTTPQSTVTFSCNGTDAMAIVVDAISFQGAFGISP